MIDIRDLEHRFADGTPALRGVNLTIADGEFLVICGANGSGKTTLIRHLNGLLSPSAGSVRLWGVDVGAAGRRAREWVGLVFQDADSQIIGETVAEDIAFGAANLGLAEAEVEVRVAEALKAFGLEAIADKPCHLLSGGEKRRLAIAGVAAMRPRCILFDEPFANLDYGGVQQVLRHLLELRDRGCTIVLTTHDVEKVIAHADRIAVLHEGQIRAVGDRDAVLSSLPEYGIRPPCYALLGAPLISWLPA
jgi:cobalt transport protein ATP-binding subunit